MNKVTIIGRLTEKPELRKAGEHDVTEFTVAVARQFKSNKTDFIRCEAWDGTAKTICEYLAKGYPIAIEGTWETGSYVNKDGKTIYTNVCRIVRFEFVPQNPKTNVADPGSTPAAFIASRSYETGEPQKSGTPFDASRI